MNVIILKYHSQVYEFYGSIPFCFYFIVALHFLRKNKMWEYEDVSHIIINGSINWDTVLMSKSLLIHIQFIIICGTLHLKLCKNVWCWRENTEKYNLTRKILRARVTADDPVCMGHWKVRIGRAWFTTIVTLKLLGVGHLSVVLERELKYSKRKKNTDILVQMSGNSITFYCALKRLFLLVSLGRAVWSSFFSCVAVHIWPNERSYFLNLLVFRLFVCAFWSNIKCIKLSKQTQ